MPGLHLRIGELARLTNLSPDSLRHYGRLGLISATRTPGGFREYSADAVQRVHVVQAALAMGFSLDELAEIFAIRRAGGAPCRRVRTLAGAKLVTLGRKIQELSSLRTHLARTLADWDAALDRTPAGKPARLLESLCRDPAAHRPVPKHRSRALLGGQP